MNRKAFKDQNFKIQNIRANFNQPTLFKSLFKTQKGICPYCEDILEMNGNDILEIHHKYQLKDCITKSDQTRANKRINICLLHRHCHKNLHSKEGIGYEKGLLYKN